MKLLIMYENKAEIYDGVLKLSEVSKFINTKFSEVGQNWMICFPDEDKEQVIIDSNQDLSFMEQHLAGKEIVCIKLRNQKEKIKFIEKAKQAAEQLEEKQIIPSQKLQSLILNKIEELVQDKIAQLIPSLFQLFKANQFTKGGIEVHKNIQCNNCKVKPIVGIRYQSSENETYNLCQICEEVVQHQYKLFKIRKHKEQKKIKNQGQSFGNSLLEIIAEITTTPQPSDELEKPSPIKHKMSEEDKKRGKKLAAAFGGKAKEYKQFLENNQDLNLEKLLVEYAKENGKNQFLQKHKKKLKKKRLRKLEIYFQKDQEQFVELVENNPDSNIRELLKILKQEGKYDFDLNDENKFSKMENKFRREVKGSKQLNLQLKKSQSKAKQSKVQVQKEQQEGDKLQKQLIQGNTEKFDLEQREKGRILLEMEQIFFDDKPDQVFEFIQKNFPKTQNLEELVEKYLAQRFQNNKKIDS